jgi:hypothetical protein
VSFWRRGLVVLSVVFLLTPTASAHELGVTQVNAEFRRDGSFQVDIAVDPDALLTRLEAYGRREISSGLAPAERDRRIAALADVFLDRVEIRFDGSRRRPRFEYLPAASDARTGDPGEIERSLPGGPPANLEPIEPSRVRLTGRQPAGAGTWTFLHGAAIGSFAMNIRIGDSPVEEVWLEGGRPSAPLPLATGESLQAWAQRAAWMAIGLIALCWHASRVVRH